MNIFLGIDVSKNKLDVFINGHFAQFDNNPLGFKALLSWLKKKKIHNFSVCLESTGKYSNAVALFFYQNNYPVSIVNPALIKSFAKSLGLRSKTDKLDAQTIARFAEINHPKRWNPPSKEIESLVEITRLITDLTSQKQALKNKLEAGIQNNTVKKSLLTIINSIEEQIKGLEKLAEKVTNEDDELKKKKELLKSIPGISDRTAEVLLAETKGGVEKFHSARALAVHSGVTPALRHSGMSCYGGHISRQGNKHLRSKLYFPVLSAIRHNRIIKEFYERLLSKGKSKMSAICACIRKLLHIVYGVLKNGIPFNPNYQNLAFTS